MTQLSSSFRGVIKLALRIDDLLKHKNINKISFLEPGGPIRRPMAGKAEIQRPWIACLADNRSKWKDRAAKGTQGKLLYLHSL